MSFDKAIIHLNEKRSKLISDLKHMYEKEKSNVEREKYKRKKHLDEINEVYSELKKADKKIFNLDNEKVFVITRRNQQRLNVITEAIFDFSTRVIKFTDNIKFKDTGIIQSHNKIITHESITKEARGKSVDTRMSKETFEDIEDFPNHPKFEYEAPIITNKAIKSKRNKDKLKESLHNSTSPRLHRNSTVKQMKLNYVTSNMPGQNITYNPKEKLEGNENDMVPELIFQNESVIKKNMKNLPSNKNHKSMLKLHEKGFKKVSSFFERDRSAACLGVKNQLFNLDRTNNITDKYTKGSLSKIAEVPNTERSNYAGLEPPMLKPSKSKSRYDNQVLSSSEKDESHKYKRHTSNTNSRLGEYTEPGVKQSKESSEIIKSLAKDDFNPFLFNAFGDVKNGQEHSERVSNNKLFSRVPKHLHDGYNENKSSTVNMKEQLEIIRNDKTKKKYSDHSHVSDSGKWNK